ncbi:MAG: ABC transporter permease [Verrucomicrobia bacterium]|nr:ABC transporter permease [Verrucomicrobiota bacterium]
MSEPSAISGQRTAPGDGQSGDPSHLSPLTSGLPLSPNQRAWRRFRRNRVAVVSAWFLAAVVLLVLLWPLLSPYSPVAISEAQFQPPDTKHWFGADLHGRDLLSRVFYGARISLLVGVVGAGVSLVIGVLWGAVAGYLGGRWDSVMMRFVDVLYSLPSIVFVIVLLTTLNAFLAKAQGKFISADGAALLRFTGLFAGLGAVSWLTMARIVRGQVLSLRTRGFVEASRVLGASHARILLSHILPNVLGVIIVYVTLTVPSIILYESFLSYLGLGVQPPYASLGSLIADGVGQLNPVRVYWWLILFPATLLALTLLALNFFGDGLRDALDVHAERR